MPARICCLCDKSSQASHSASWKASRSFLLLPKDLRNGANPLPPIGQTLILLIPLHTSSTIICLSGYSCWTPSNKGPSWITDLPTLGAHCSASCNSCRILGSCSSGPRFGTFCGKLLEWLGESLTGTNSCSGWNLPFRRRRFGSGGGMSADW